ncbi:MAG: hypothetical protein EOO77_14575 [Oxalobacteraceae bacterium]|nr:MAG: hypothetical protein EOO77_14575 [Oxalobacteraceae bacterium]
MHRLQDRGRVVFLHPLADQRSTLGADVAQLRVSSLKMATAFEPNGLVGSWRSLMTLSGAQGMHSMRLLLFDVSSFGSQ